MYVVLGSDPPSHLDFQSHYPPSHDIFQHALCRGSVDFVQKNSLEFILTILQIFILQITVFHFPNFRFCKRQISVPVYSFKWGVM